MKKIYALAAVAFMAMAANAQNGAPLYITGDGFDPAWSAIDPQQFTWDAATSTYVFEGANLSSFAISTAKEEEGSTTWDVFNAARLQATTVDKNGEWVDLTAGTGNILAPFPTVAPSEGKIEVKGDLSQIKITMTSEQATWGVYLRGDMNGWLNDADDATRAQWQLKLDKGTTYYINFAEGQAIPAETPFKIADEKWAWVNFGCGDENKDPRELDVPTSLDYNGGSNITLTEECTGSVVITLNAENLMEPAEVIFSNEKYVPEEGGVAGVVVEEGAAQYFNLQGVRIDEPAHGLYIVVKGGKAVKAIK